MPLDAPAAELHYAYDANDARVIKTAVDPAGAERHTLYIFATLELRRSVWDAGDDTYTRDALTEVPYLLANGVRLGRVVFEPAAKEVPTIGDGRPHVFFELGDHLGSTNIVLDKATSELVELSTFQAYGATENDYRPERWKGFREDYRFTGKEKDVEVGLVYFGARYYAPQLGRWISPDPLAVHAAGADLNAYAYIHGNVLRTVDVAGLLEGWERKLDDFVNPENGLARGVTDALAARGQALVEGTKALIHLAKQDGVIKATATVAKEYVPTIIEGAKETGRHAKALGEAIADLDSKKIGEHATHTVLGAADTVAAVVPARAAVQTGAKSGSAGVRAIGRPRAPALRAALKAELPTEFTFPSDPAKLLPDVPHKVKANGNRVIQPSETLRIRAEQHPVKSGETFAPRHHGLHYHVEIRLDPTKGWKGDNVVKVKPENYVYGEGTGFLPGEKFPGK